MIAKYKVPETVNYVAAFLTFRCTLGCSYCINKHGLLTYKPEMSMFDWIHGLGRLELRPDLPITLQGGEPTQHPGCWRIINSLYHKDKHVDLLTNGEFDVDKFIGNVSPEAMKRDAKYASIRFSYHPEKLKAHQLADKVVYLQEQGYSVGIWGLDHPDNKADNKRMRDICKNLGIDFRMKEYLGWTEDGNGCVKWNGTMKYINACESRQKLVTVDCRTSELLISPSGHIHRCHSDLYHGINPIGHILDKKLPEVRKWRSCSRFGLCNPCDIKVKTNRLQEYGYTAVEIRKRGRRG